MIKPKAINCNSAGRFCFAHLQNADWCTDQKKSNMTKAKVVTLAESDEKPMNEMIRPEQIRRWFSMSRSREGCNPFVSEVQEVVNVLLGARDKVLGRLRVAAIVQLNGASPFSTRYYS